MPLFIGFVCAGVPLGVTFSFLIAAPMINEVALGLLFALVGWKVALTYLAFGLAVAIVGGFVIGKLKLEGWLEDVGARSASGRCRIPHGADQRRRPHQGRYRRRPRDRRQGLDVDHRRNRRGRCDSRLRPGRSTGLDHGRDAWWSVPAAVLIGIPMYSNAAGIIPVVEALIGKGAALGTVLAFMMSVIALSLPEMIILRKVLTLKLIAVFVGVVASGILAVGFLFNALFQ